MARIHRNPAQWTQLLEEYQTSGMTIAEFCQSRQLSTSSFYLWRKRLDGAPAEGAPQKSVFIDVTPEPRANSPEQVPWDVELDLGDGIVLRLRRAC